MNQHVCILWTKRLAKQKRILQFYSIWMSNTMPQTRENEAQKKHPNVNFCGFCDLEFMIAHFVNRIQIKTTNINNNHLLWPSNGCLEASDTAWIEMCFKIRIWTIEWCVWVFLSVARFIFISFALQDHFIRNGIPASNEYSDLIRTANYRE